MRTLDRYIVRNFLHSYMLCFLVMMGLRIVADLFVNMDEFSEQEMDFLARVAYIGQYYMYHSLVYFQELGGVILIAAAAFSLARMNHTNELTAVMASGMSLHRVILPVVLAAMALALMGAVNQEVLIPNVKDQLVRDRDDGPGGADLRVDIIVDSQRNAWYSRRYQDRFQRMENPLVICRDRRAKQVGKLAGRAATWAGEGLWRFTGANAAVFSPTGRHLVSSSRFVLSAVTPAMLADSGGAAVVEGVRISAGRIDPAGRRLIGPRFEILSPEVLPGEASAARVLGTLTAEAAWYGPAGKDGEQAGYYLEGRPELTGEQIVHWRRLCRRLCDGETAPVGRLIRRVWDRLPAETRTDAAAIADGKAPREGRAAMGVLAALNAILDQRDFFQADDFAGRAAPLSPALRRALRGERSAMAAEQVRRLNRYALDAAAAGLITPCQGELLVATDLQPKEIVLRQTGKWMDYMSSSQISDLLATGRIPDVKGALMLKHLRFTAPLSTIVMLLLGLPFIVSRERHIKVSALACVMVVGGFHVFVFVCRYLGGEAFESVNQQLQAYGFAAASPQWGPIVAAWAPILVFGPVAALLLDGMENMPVPHDNRTSGQIFFSPTGRLDRRTFWLKGVAPLAAAGAAALLVDLCLIGRPGLLYVVAALACLGPMAIVQIKRCHDRGRSGWCLLANLLPVIGPLWYLYDVGLLDGQAGPNSYGADPLGRMTVGVEPVKVVEAEQEG